LAGAAENQQFVPEKDSSPVDRLTEYPAGGIRLTIEMKTLLVTVLIALAGVSSTQAQILRPSVGSGAVVGAVAGGLIGGHNGDRWAEGAVLGGVAGALIGAALTPQEPVYHAPPPVYQAPIYGQQVYGQQVYGQPVYGQTTTVVQAAPTVPNAPVVGNAPTVYEQAPVQVVHAPPHVVQAPPQVVYVESAPRVVYVTAAPRVVYAPPPPVMSFGFGLHSGPRYQGGYRCGYSHPSYRYTGGGHRGHHGHRR